MECQRTALSIRRPTLHASHHLRRTAQGRATYGWTLDELEKQATVGTAAEIGERVQAVVDAGATYIITYFPRIAYDHTPMQRFAEDVAPQIR